MVWKKLFGEHATSKIVAIFDTESAAATAAATLHANAKLQSTQLRMVKPHEKHFEKKLEPETRGVARTALRAHLILGVLGFIVGLVVWAALYYSNIDMIQSTPRGSLGVLLFLGTVAGLLMGGLVTARPDHQLFITKVRTATEEGRWSLIIHPYNTRQYEAVMAELDGTSGEIIKTL